MLNILINSFKNLDELTYKIMKNGFKFCFIICLISTTILFLYNLILSSPIWYYIGLSLLKLSLSFAIYFIICGLVVDSIKKEII